MAAGVKPGGLECVRGVRVAAAVECGRKELIRGVHARSWTVLDARDVHTRRSLPQEEEEERMTEKAERLRASPPRSSKYSRSKPFNLTFKRNNRSFSLCKLSHCSESEGYT